MATGSTEAIIQAVGAVLAALIVTGAAMLAARSFEPLFVRWGHSVARLDFLILLAEQDDGSGCSVLLSTTVPLRVGPPDSGRYQYSGQTVDDDDECEAIRRVLAPYTVDTREGSVPR